MDEPKTVTTAEVLNLLREALESVWPWPGTSRREDFCSRTASVIIDLKVTAPGGAAIELHIASPAITGGGTLPFWGQASAHLMDIEVTTGGPLVTKFSVGGYSWSQPYQLKVGPQSLTVTTPD